jgi:hypothetical protein
VAVKERLKHASQDVLGGRLFGMSLRPLIFGFLQNSESLPLRLIELWAGVSRENGFRLSHDMIRLTA